MRVILRLIPLGVLAAMIAWSVLTWPHIPAAERGRRLAQTQGCFTCHGEGGLKGAMNPGRKDKSVPGFGGDVMMYADDVGDLREWIRDGVTKRRAVSKSWQEQRDKGALRMPAFGRRLSGGQIDDLAAYVMAASGDPEPDDSLASAGLKRAGELGCVGCHGAGGRFAARNPRSLKGYIPSWDEADFPELVRDRAEFDAWVQHGVSDRFRDNPAAGFFLKRAAVHMPAYEKHLEPGDLDKLWAYVRWLRRPPSGSWSHPARLRGARAGM